MADSPAFGRRPQFKNNHTNPEIFQHALELCPGLKLSHTPETLNRIGAIESLTKKWGPVLEVLEGYASDPEIRFKGSSGGIISAISLYCVEHEGMYGVLHTSADEKKAYLNKTTMSINRTHLLVAAGSRYSPASPCEGLHEIEKAPLPCVFVGKPCDVAATYNVRLAKPELNPKIGLTIACFCAGTPSTNGTMEMLKNMGIEFSKNLKELRYRGYGWPGKTVAISHNSDNTITTNELTYEQSWGKILQKHRPWRCYICPDHTGEFADIAVGDPWYKKMNAPDSGQSLILVRTQKGKEIINRAIKNGYILTKKAEPKILPASQPNLLKTRAALWGRLMSLKMIGAPCPTYQGFHLKQSWNEQLSYIEKVKSIFGTIKRVFKKSLKTKQNIPFN
ncbi:Coenzyme F420 hydrogenase/dehydrogenase, beta subunit C-terminal domain [Desulfosarcina ovata]|nr:Coenzyme F420 hydrogenase/dehydrogenase, beta subunit C-terminal domain [Desulfosarcina ovata]